VIAERRRGEAYSNWGNHKFDLTPQRLLDEGRGLTARLREAGMEPWGTVPGINVDTSDEDLRVAFEGAVAADACCVRCNPPGYPNQPFDYAGFCEHVVQRYHYVTERLSWPLGIKLIIETHAGSLATGPGLAWNIVRHFAPQRVGVIFDLPNFAKEGGVNPNLAVSVLRNYIDCLHVGGAQRFEADERDERGCRIIHTRFCPLQDSDLHVPTWLELIEQSDVSPPLIIEDYDERLAGAERLKRTVDFLNKLGHG
jgi:sugar phosphate isomerase/epimerase